MRAAPRRGAALARVQADLAPKGLGLKVYDCYRPTRAVAAMAAWAQDPRDQSTRRFFPAVRKRNLFAPATSPRTRRIRPAPPST